MEDDVLSSVPRTMAAVVLIGQDRDRSSAAELATFACASSTAENLLAKAEVGAGTVVAMSATSS